MWAVKRPSALSKEGHRVLDQMVAVRFRQGCSNAIAKAFDQQRAAVNAGEKPDPAAHVAYIWRTPEGPGHRARRGAINADARSCYP